MALETGTYISDLVATNPTGSDPLAFADDHLRLVKSTLKSTFPNITGAVTKTHAEINALASQTQLTDLETSLTAAIATAVAATKTALYPVGSIYVNAGVTTNPATLLGFGTWTAFGAGRVMVGLNGSDTLFDALEETGGSKDAVVVSHNHSASTSISDPGHNHTRLTAAVDSAGGTGRFWGTNGIDNGTFSDTVHSNTTGITASTTVNSTGSSGTNANLQPYITVAMWKRTA